MGYYASGYGECVLKDETDLALIDHDLNRNGARVIDVDRLTVNKIRLCAEEQKYYQEEVYLDLNILTKYITEGYIEYAGEDDAHWKIMLKDGKWVQQQGKTIYDLSDIPDDDLLNELRKRGYKQLRK